MSRFLACCLCLLASPALAIEITQDTTIDYSILDESNTVQVRGGAVLKIDLNGDGVRPIIISHINLWDDSSLLFTEGDMRGDIRVLGDNQIDFVGGRFGNRHIVGGGNAVINIDGETKFGATMEFSGGRQEINIHGFDSYSAEPRIRFSSGANVTVFSERPVYGTGPQYASLGVELTGDTSGGHGSFYVQNGISWQILPADNRPVGDVNGDQVVDLEDLNSVRNFFGSHDFHGDTFPMDGSVGLEDLNRVRNTFGQVSQPVPEPSSLSLTALALFSLAGIALPRRMYRSRLQM